MAMKENADTRVRYGRLLGLICIIAGFVAIILGWNGSASRACIDCQMPYLLSGGFGGLGLVVFGSALLVVSGLRAERMHLQKAIEDSTGVGSALASASFTKPDTGASPNGTVVMGRSTYHRPDCRLVQGKDDLERVSVEQAAASGLSACRVCNPAKADRRAAAAG